MTIELNRDNYEDEVNQSDTLMLVDFWGPRCKPCMALMPSVEELEKEYEGKLKVGKLNAEQNRMLCARLRVMGLPTFLFYKDGTEVKRISGEDITKDQIKEAIETMIEA
ncbi:thioredoxin family protein [bacterium]|nr:thioredoxin family protein [bacterium]